MTEKRSEIHFDKNCDPVATDSATHQPVTSNTVHPVGEVQPHSSSLFESRLNRRRFSAMAMAWSGLAILGTMPIASKAQDDSWPSRPLRMIVGYPPGSSQDVQARFLAEPLSAALGKPVIVENRPGAGGSIGVGQLAKANDGHTVGLVGNGPMTSAPFLQPQLSYDPIKDFAPIALVNTAPLVLVVPPDMFDGDIKAFLKRIREEGDSLAYASIGAGSGGHLGIELLKDSLGFSMLHVPYAGGPAIINAMLGGQVKMALLPYSIMKTLVESGKLKAVVVSSKERSNLVPGAPSMKDLGVSNLDIEVWHGILAPASMPVEHQARLKEALSSILKTPEIKSTFFQQGWEVGETSSEALQKRIISDTALYKGIISKRGIKLN